MKDDYGSTVRPVGAPASLERVKVQRLTEATGPYAKKGDTYWKRITPSIEPFHVKQEAIDFMVDVACYPTTGE